LREVQLDKSLVAITKRQRKNKTPPNVEQTTPSSAIPAVQNIRVCIFNNALADVSADDGE
jgi:hypothetical protein